MVIQVNLSHHQQELRQAYLQYNILHLTRDTLLVSLPTSNGVDTDYDECNSSFAQEIQSRIHREHQSYPTKL